MRYFLPFVNVCSPSFLICEFVCNLLACLRRLSAFNFNSRVCPFQNQQKFITKINNLNCVSTGVGVSHARIDEMRNTVTSIFHFAFGEFSLFLLLHSLACSFVSHTRSLSCCLCRSIVCFVAYLYLWHVCSQRTTNISVFPTRELRPYYLSHIEFVRVHEKDDEMTHSHNCVTHMDCAREREH